MYSKIILVLLVTMMISDVVYAQTPKKEQDISYNPNAVRDTLKRSIKSAAIGKIGNAKILINYHSPGVRKRVIWGGLVSFGDVWVTGAHSATSIKIDKPFKVGEKIIPAGKYALFTIPDESGWIVIINKNWQQHLADDYDPKEDLVRIKVKPVIQDSVTERLQYFIKDNGNKKGTIAVAWEKLKIEFPVAIKN